LLTWFIVVAVDIIILLAI